MSDLTFEFVSSLTFREKAYFKRFSQTYSNKENKNYLKIYGFLEKQKQYDEKALKEFFSDEKFIKYLSSEKHYLLEQLLNSLINFHFGTSTYRKLIKWILYVNILSEKGFRKKAVKVLKQAKSLAYHYEEFTIILQLIQMEEEILFSHGILNFTAQLEKLKREREEITQKIQNLNELRLLKVQARELQFEEMPHISNPEKHARIFANPFLDDEKNINSLKAQDLWLYIKSMKHYLVREFKESQISNRDHLAFFEKHDYLFNNNHKLPLLSNYLYLSAKGKDEKSFYEALEKLTDLEGEKGIDSDYLGYIKYARLFELFYKTENTIETKKLIPEVGQYLTKSKDQLGSTEVDYILILMIRACIETYQFSKAQQWLNIWHKTKTIDVSLNIIKLFTMITYYELGYLPLLQYEINSTYKTLKKRKKLNKLERLFIRFFKKFIKDPNLKKNQKLLLSLKESLTELKADPHENILFEQFDFLKWCDQKLTEFPPMN
jgi:hypothetical protein